MVLSSDCFVYFVPEFASPLSQKSEFGIFTFEEEEVYVFFNVNIIIFILVSFLKSTF